MKSTAKPKRDHSAIATQYATDVVAGKIPACGWVQKACQRHLDDLANDSVLWPYTFDTKKANRVCKIIELLPLVKGSQFVGLNLVLQPWQCFIVCNLFGWVKKATGKRMFRKCYVEVPKGNGKSALMSGIALVMLACDGEPGAEVYSAAITKEQAKIVFETAQQMARKCRRFLEKYGVEVAAHDIHLAADTLSVFRALASEADSLEGKNPHLVVIDELHAHTRGHLCVLPLRQRWCLAYLQPPSHFQTGSRSDWTQGISQLVAVDYHQLLLRHHHKVVQRADSCWPSVPADWLHREPMPHWCGVPSL